MNLTHNAAYPWDDFDSQSYFNHNYRDIRADDRRIVEYVRDFFVEAFDRPDPAAPGLRGIDVGTGPNLYPALAMLPFCGRIELYDYSAANIAWLGRERMGEWSGVADSLAAFWLVLAEDPAYSSAVPEQAVPGVLADRCTVRQGSVFDLVPDSGDPYGVGTMFFVAESMSGHAEEFSLTIKHFLDVLRPGAPFAAAFMAGSQGYEVDGVVYPAISVAEDDIRTVLAGFGVDVRTLSIPVDEDPLRAGYEGMVVAVGRTGG